MRRGRDPKRLRVMTMSDNVGAHGGAEELARQIAQRLDPDRFESIYCATRYAAAADDEWVLEALRSSGTGFIGLERTGKLALGSWRRLIAEMRQREIDVLHTHKIGSNFWGSLIAPRVPVEVFVAHEHSWAYRGQPLRKAIDRYLIGRRADAFVAVSEADRRRMIEVEKIPPHKVRFIQNGIPDSDPAQPGRDIRAELGIAPERPLVVAVGTLRPEKAYEHLIDAAALVRRDVPGVCVLIVGGEESEAHDRREPLARHISELGLEDNVRLLGFRPDVDEILRVVDVTCLNSDREGSPLSVMEYMEAAKPVVASRVGGVPDIVVDGETGLLVEPRDAQGLAAALTRLLRDPELARAMGEAGQRRRRELYTVEATARAVGDLYLELYAEKAGAP